MKCLEDRLLCKQEAPGSNPDGSIRRDNHPSNFLVELGVLLRSDTSKTIIK